MLVFCALQRKAGGLRSFQLIGLLPDRFVPRMELQSLV
jgi:hypothetical protein